MIQIVKVSEMLSDDLKMFEESIEEKTTLLNEFLAKGLCSKLDYMRQMVAIGDDLINKLEQKYPLDMAEYIVNEMFL